jgi:hypothetical protein
MLYRQSLSVPLDLAGEAGTDNEIESPTSAHNYEPEHEDNIFLRFAEAGRRVLKIYSHLIKITW